MTKLIKLELTKNKLSTYLIAAMCIFIFGLGLCFMMAYIPQLERLDAVASVTPVDMAMFEQWSNFLPYVSIIFAMSFSILSAVMHTKFTVEEYTGKRAVLLFSYPQSRSKILFAKCTLVFFFTVIGMFVCNIAAVAIFAIISNIFGIMPEPFKFSMITNMLSVAGVCGFLAASVGLISMRVGFWKKSLVATVVTSVLLVSPFGNIMSFFPQHSAVIHLLGMVVFLIIGLLIFIELMVKVNKMEAV